MEHTLRWPAAFLAGLLLGPGFVHAQPGKDDKLDLVIKGELKPDDPWEWSL